MRIKLPVFQKSCGYFCLCSRLTTRDRRVLKLLGGERKDQKWQIARSRVEGTTVFVRLGLGGAFENHFHIDVATKEHFGDRVPKTNAKMQEIREACKPFCGQELQHFMYAVFRINVKQAPEVVKSMMIQTEVDEISIKATSGTIKFDGAPIDRLEWTLLERRRSLNVEIRESGKSKVSDDFLSDGMERLTSAFASLERS